MNRCAAPQKLPMHPSNELKNIRRRVDLARRTFENTCPASRHVHTMADALSMGGYPMLGEEPEQCALSLYSVLESLWKARTELAKLKGK